MSKKRFKVSRFEGVASKRRLAKEAAHKKRIRYLASLSKNPFKRTVQKLSPKNIYEQWFNKQGLIKILKGLGIFIVVIFLVIGALFIYFRKDLNSISPGELAKKVATNVNVYYDRNGQLLWEDKGDGDYKLVVTNDEISQSIKDATVAIEDKDFYNHGGISISGLTRAVFNNLVGGDTQGGSTLTQQLVKQVFFADEASQRGLSGIPRKIKEMILSIEVERMYTKAQILNLYLNESPYGGRRNGVESAAQTYFAKSAKDLSLPEAALIASIPQSPTLYNPYNIDGHDALIARQHKVLDNMAEQGKITKAQAEEAKKYPILDHITPESSQYNDIKAPHFIQMVKSELIKKLGQTKVGQGGLIITTTLDLRIQNKAEEAMADMFNSNTPKYAGFDNGAATVEDVKSGQIIAMVGSRDYNYPGFGQNNAAMSYLQPGSSIKPLVYSQLFQKKPAGQMNYGSGSILSDTNIDAIYGAPVFNADHTFKGDITIRSALATSRNIPAIKAMYISGVKNTLGTIHDLGATSYCTQGDETTVGLSSAIGSCGVKQIDLVNAYASLARLGTYVPQSSILEVKNTSGDVLQKWTNPAQTQVVDPQSAYIVGDILADDIARSPLAGRYAKGSYIPGVKTATKTGTSDKGGNAKDIWMMSYSPVIAMGVWLGNADASILRNGTSQIPGPIIDKVMAYAHKEIYAADGRWKSGDWLVRPSGIQAYNNELYPSWWNKDQGKTNAKLTFDRVSKRVATDLTPDGARIELDVVKMIDPVTGKDVYIAPDGYDATQTDNVHLATDTKPSVSVTVSKTANDKNYTITATVSQGTFTISTVQISVGGTVVSTQSANGTNVYTYSGSMTGINSDTAVTVTVTDSGYYVGTASGTILAK